MRMAGGEVSRLRPPWLLEISEQRYPQKIFHCERGGGEGSTTPKGREGKRGQVEPKKDGGKDR